VTVLCVSYILLMFFTGMWGTQNIEFCHATGRISEQCRGICAIELLWYSAGLSVYTVGTFCIVTSWRSWRECREYRTLQPAGLQTKIHPFYTWCEGNARRNVWDSMQLSVNNVTARWGLNALWCVSLCDYDTRCLSRSVTFHGFPMFISYKS